MIIKSIKFKKIIIISISIIIIFIIICNVLIKNTFIINGLQTLSSSFIWDNTIEKDSKNKYIKWVDFTPTYEALDATSKLDIDSHNNNETIKYNWIELLAYLACKYGGNFKKFDNKDLVKLTNQLKNGKTMASLTNNLKYYSYYYEAYDAVLHGFIGNYEISTSKTDNNQFTKKYGIKAFSPIASNYSFSHYDDFGASRSYGYKRVHLGHDLMGNIGTPIIAVESGVVEALGWNQYGGWRIGIRSFDGKRYYYYAHLRKNHPYAQNLQEGQTVKAGDVIGYLGMTGYSTTENVNNINVPHLHFGLQLIFDDSQKDGSNQIWIDMYSIVEFLKKNSSDVYKAPNSNEFYRKNNWNDLSSIDSFMP